MSAATPEAPSDAHHAPRNRILVGDARSVLDTLPANSIDTVITSPPYFRLRNYQHGGQIGLEDHVDQWVDELLLVVRGLKRVLKPTRLALAQPRRHVLPA